MYKTEDPAINRHYPIQILEQRKWP